MYMYMYVCVCIYIYIYIYIYICVCVCKRILRKIFGPVNIDNVWRTRNNMETDKLIEGADIVRFITAQRVKWLGHIQRMD